MNTTKLEIIWGIPLMEAGFSAIPNLLIRNFRKLGIEHGEWSFLCQLISFKHDSHDPYPSRKTLANFLGCSVRQISKWVASLKAKGLLRTGRMRNSQNKQWERTIYSLQPLLDALFKLIGKKEAVNEPQYGIEWDDAPGEPEVPNPGEPEVPNPGEPEVPTKRKDQKTKMKRDDDDRDAYQILKFEFIDNQLLDSNEFEHVMNRVKKVNCVSPLAYARTSLLTAVKRKNEQEYTHKERLKEQTTRAQRKQRPSIPVVKPEQGVGLSPEELERARELARQLDARRKHSFTHA